MNIIIKNGFSLPEGKTATISLVEDTREIFQYERVEVPFNDNGGLSAGDGWETSYVPTWREETNPCLQMGETGYFPIPAINRWIKIEVSESRKERSERGFLFIFFNFPTLSYI